MQHRQANIPAQRAHPFVFKMLCREMSKFDTNPGKKKASKIDPLKPEANETGATKESSLFFDSLPDGAIGHVVRFLSRKP